ncbi:MAG: outer membrane beta-barrel protein, partial [Candidatus Hodarchaeota archaeon]
MFRFKFLLFVVITLAIFSPILADAKWSLTPRIYVEGLYDDNIFLTERNEQDDFITRVSPGVNLNYETPSGKVDLDYEFRRSFYNDFSELDYSAHHARAEARMDFVSWFGAGINEVFIRDEDPIELVEITEFESPSIRTGERDRYTRNIATPWATVRFGDDRSIRIEYRNHILRNDREDIADQDENAGNATFIFRFNIHNGIEIFYEHIDLEYSETVPLSDDIDHDGDEIRGRYTYYFNPRTSAFVEYRYWHRDFESESFFYFDYEVHNPTLGFTWDLYQNVTLSARGGYTVRNA